MQTTTRQIMINAHQIARRLEGGSYSQRLSVALKMAWAEARQPNTNEIASQIADRINNADRGLSARVWEGNNTVRVYVDELMGNRGQRRRQSHYLAINADGGYTPQPMNLSTAKRDIRIVGQILAA